VNKLITGILMSLATPRLAGRRRVGQWDRLKHAEKGTGTNAHPHSTAFTASAGLMRAQKLWKKARRAGLAWRRRRSGHSAGKRAVAAMLFELSARCQEKGWSGEGSCAASTTPRTRVAAAGGQRADGRPGDSPPIQQVRSACSGSCPAGIDRVDYSLCDIAADRIRLIRAWTARFPGALQARLHAAARNDATTYEVGQLHHDLGRFYALGARRPVVLGQVTAGNKGRR
jgi:hypothetical protein